MLPYSLKLVWFSLSLSGLISCWAVLSAFALAIRSYWLALLYCIGCTILQGMFCLGLIWRMDPFLMPRSFCIAQTLLSGFASFLLTGVCATFSMITSLAISSSGAWNMTSAKMYAWHPNYTLTLIIFPLLASVAQITTVLRLNAAQPTDGFACDANRPEWVRFLSYAGIPLVFSIPFSCFGLMAIIRMSRSQQRIIERYRNSTEHANSKNFTSLPLKRIHRKDMSNFLGSRSSPTPIPTPRAIPSPSPSLAYPTSPGRVPISPVLYSPVLSARQFHLPFSPLSANDDHDSLGSCHSSTLENQDDTNSSVSSALPTFAPPRNPDTRNPRESPGHDFVGHHNGTSPDYHYRGSHPVHAQAPRYSPTTGWDWYDHDDDVSSVNWTQCDTTRNENHSNYVDAELDYVRTHGKNQYEFGKETGDLHTVNESRIRAEESPNFQYTTRNLQVHSPAMPSPFSSTGNRRRTVFSISPVAGISPLENVNIIRPALWHIIVFQLSFTLILVLACISTLIDVISRRTRPTPFGTQHVALLLTAWGPVVVFGSIPSTQRNLMFWKRTFSNP
ncbi:hypothetical protein GGU10DRAFT_390026 [Lentinula aff. detonsa]|uniref:Uncharacterized protein n=1 Tax=Lentinula aff. detonsa TaxID=2804958 RepID=A0AA38KMH5_9AGAR|nr:hypothetical protein GGU10DRAFT_390026 [Lentinula aff. detonsa]